MKKLLFQDTVYLIVIAVLYIFLSIGGLNWDQIQILNGYGLDPDSEGVKEALGYLHNFSNYWDIGHKTYPQGYGLLLAIFFKSALTICSILNINPCYDIAYLNHILCHGILPSVNLELTTPEGRIFFFFAARLMSSLFGFLTVCLVYVISCRVSSQRIVGLGAALLISSCYPFMLYTQTAKYMAVSIFFYLLVIQLAIKLTDNPGYPSYLCCGAAVGVSCAMIYYNAVSITLLFLAHWVALYQTGEIKSRKLFFDSRLLLAMATAGIVFIALNPRIIAHGWAFLMAMLNWNIELSHRGDLKLFQRYTGIAGLLPNLHENIGLALTGAVLAGLILTFRNWRPWKIPMVFTGIFYLGFSIVNITNYVTANMYPSLCILAATALYSILQKIFGRISWVASRQLGAVFIIITLTIATPGFARTVEENLINRNFSTELQAGIWVKQHLSPKSVFLWDEDVIICQGMQKEMRLNYYAGPNMLSHTSRDFFWSNGPDLFKAQYAIVGSRLFSEVLSEKNLSRYPARRHSVSENGVGYGLRETYADYVNLLKKYAIPLHMIRAGNWIGQDQRNISGVQFLGVPLNQLTDFFSRPAGRTHGPEIIIYELTPDFWAAFRRYLGIPIDSCSPFDNTLTQDLSSFKISAAKVAYYRAQNTINIVVEWQGSPGAAMDYVNFQLLNTTRKEISTIKRIKNLYQKQPDLQFKEFLCIKKPEEKVLRTYNIVLPQTMLKGNYIVSITHPNFIELGRIDIQ